MSEFKVGDKIVIIQNPTSNCTSKLRVGDTAKIDTFFFDNAGQKISARMACDSKLSSCYHNLENIELAPPKWSIYKNDLPWGKLSNKQKGKALLAELDGLPMNIIAKSPSGGDLFICCEKINSSESVVYRARPEPVKLEPTMAELFIADWRSLSSESDAKQALMIRGYDEIYILASQIIAKGWTKPCK